jgi:hypothetical protein
MKWCRRLAAVAFLAVMAMGIGVMPNTAHAKCKVFEGYHNGTNMFHETGSKGAAINHLLSQIELWKRDAGIQKVRMGKVKTQCGEPFMKYLLTHTRCTAKARICY